MWKWLQKGWQFDHPKNNQIYGFHYWNTIWTSPLHVSVHLVLWFICCSVYPCCTWYMFQHSLMAAYCILLRANPRLSLLRVMGDWPTFSISSLAFAITSCLVHGAGTSSTNGTKYGGFICHRKFSLSFISLKKVLQMYIQCTVN